MSFMDREHRCASCGSVGETLELTAGRLSVALLVLDKLEAMVTRIGGSLATPDQAIVRDARAVLVELGKRRPAVEATWEDRTCTCLALAEGTNRTRHCALHPLPAP